MRTRLLIFALGNFAVGTESLVFAGILPSIAHDLHVSVTLAGQLVTIYSLTFAIASPILIALTGKISPRRLLVGAFTLFVVSNILAILAPNFGILALARFLAACGAGIYTPTASAVAVSMVSPEERGRALGIVFTGLAISTVLGVPLGTFIGATFGWRATFIVIALFGLITIGGILTLFRDSVSPQPASLRAWGSLLADRYLLIALVITVLQFIGQFTVYTYIAPLLLHAGNFNEASLSLVLLLYGIAGVIGSSLGGYSVDRWSTIGTVALSLAILALSLGVLPLVAPSIVGAALVIGLWGLVGVAFTPAQQRYLLSIAPQAASVVLALNSSAVFLGTALGAVVGGIVIQNIGTGLVGPAGGLFPVLALVALALSTRIGHAVSRSSNSPQHFPHEDNGGVAESSGRADRLSNQEGD
jgi:DHA1 family purine base/nucleoside efflux pump-like MFS transporter